MASVTARWLDSSGTVRTQQGSGPLDRSQWEKDASWVWIDVLDQDDETLGFLRDSFELHPLAIEDADHHQTRPKLDIFPNGLFLVWITPSRNGAGNLEMHELDIFLGQGYLITLHRGPIEAIDSVCRNAQRTLAAGPDWTLHAIIDQLVDSAIPLVDEIGERLDRLEDRIIDRWDGSQLQALHHLRRELTRLHRVAAPERDVLRSVSRERTVVSDDAYRYFQDVGDHVARLLDSIETYQDVAASVMDVFLSAQNNRMNEIMKQLTIVATIFMPLTLLSGIYGMNLLAGMWPPPLAPWGFAGVVASMFVIAFAMLAYFRTKRWW